MTRTEQVEFVIGLSENVVGDIVAKIEAGKTPENWNGLELRQLLADKFREAAFVKMPRRRKRAYNNVVIVNNL